MFNTMFECFKKDSMLFELIAFMHAATMLLVKVLKNLL